MANYKVNQKTREVTAYMKSISEQDYKIINRYRENGYDIIMLERETPRKRTGYNKKDMEIYLKNNIDNALYNEMLERFAKKQNFLEVNSWLVEQLKEYAEKNKSEYVKIADIIKSAKEQQNLEKSKEEKARAEKKTTENIIDLVETSKKK